MTIHISEEALNRARAMRASKVGWKEIGRRLGYDRDSIRCRIEDGYRRRRGTKKPTLVAVPVQATMIRVASNARPTEADIQRLLDTVPRDTRNLTARLCGDPLPGRAALDKRVRQFPPQFTYERHSSE